MIFGGYFTLGHYDADQGIKLVDDIIKTLCMVRDRNPEWKGRGPAYALGELEAGTEEVAKCFLKSGGDKNEALLNVIAVAVRMLNREYE